MADPNLRFLIDAAKLLKPILGELVFVGGCTTGLLITDEAAADEAHRSLLIFREFYLPMQPTLTRAVLAQRAAVP